MLRTTIHFISRLIALVALLLIARTARAQLNHGALEFTRHVQTRGVTVFYLIYREAALKQLHDPIKYEAFRRNVGRSQIVTR